jgi:hypothetical protein
MFAARTAYRLTRPVRRSDEDREAAGRVTLVNENAHAMMGPS